MKRVKGAFVMARRYRDSKFSAAAAREARTGVHGPTAGHHTLKKIFGPGDKVKLRDGRIGTVKEETSWGDYILKEYPKRYFPPSTLEQVPRL